MPRPLSGAGDGGGGGVLTLVFIKVSGRNILQPLPEEFKEGSTGITAPSHPMSGVVEQASDSLKRLKSAEEEEEEAANVFFTAYLPPGALKTRRLDPRELVASLAPLPPYGSDGKDADDDDDPVSGSRVIGCSCWRAVQ